MSTEPTPAQTAQADLSKAGNVVDAALKPKVTLTARIWVFAAALVAANAIGVLFHF